MFCLRNLRVRLQERRNRLYKTDFRTYDAERLCTNSHICTKSPAPAQKVGAGAAGLFPAVWELEGDLGYTEYIESNKWDKSMLGYWNDNGRHGEPGYINGNWRHGIAKDM